MTLKTMLVVFIIALLLVFLGATVALTLANNQLKALEKTISLKDVARWYPTERVEPPVSEPIVGFWIVENRPEIAIVIRVGWAYREYSTNPKQALPIRFGYPPLYWSRMPGATE